MAEPFGKPTPVPGVGKLQGLQRDGRVRIMLANLGQQPQQVRVRGPALSPQVRLRYLDETNALEAMRSPDRYRAEAWQPVSMAEGELVVALRPFAYCCLDSTGP